MGPQSFMFEVSLYSSGLMSSPPVRMMPSAKLNNESVFLIVYASSIIVFSSEIHSTYDFEALERIMNLLLSSC